MMTIQQDMTLLRKGVLFHQVNCQGVMGGGIAASFARKFPGLEKQYRQFIVDNADRRSSDAAFDGFSHEERISGSMLGKTFLYPVPQPHRSLPNDLWIANVFGQDDISSRRRMTSYDATVVAFESLQRDATFADLRLSGLPLYFPYKMGCGLGGGNWHIYASIIEAYFPDAIICQHEPV